MSTNAENDCAQTSLGLVGQGSLTGALNDRLKAYWAAQGKVANNATLGQDALRTFYSATSGQATDDAARNYWIANGG